MAGAEFVADIGVVLRTRIDVFDQERNRRARRDLCLHPFVLEDAGEDAHPIGFLALADEPGLTGTAPIEIALDVSFGQGNAGRAAIDHTAERRAMAFPERRHAKELTEGVERHLTRRNRLPCRRTIA